VLECAGDDVAEDFGIAMRVLTEALTGLDAVVIDDAQRTEPHVFGIEVIAEGERMTAVEPAPVGVSS
jgi:hypothetical protein